MRKIFIIIALVSIYLLNAETWVYDKNHPEYNQNDWRAPVWGFSYNDPQEGPLVYPTTSPFYKYDVTNLDFVAEGSGSDFKPTDGWELLYANLGDRAVGYSENEAKVALYNKERGIIRFFFREMENESHSKAYAQLRSDSNTGILSTITGDGDHIYALDQRNNDNNSQTAVKYIEEYTDTWMFADFYVAYDDIQQSENNLLYFKARATDNTQVDLDINFSTEHSSASPSLLQNVMSFGNMISEYIGKGNGLKKQIRAIPDSLATSGGLSNFVNNLHNGVSYLDTIGVTGSLPYISTVAGLFNFFSGNGSGVSTSIVNYRGTITGEMTTEFPISSFTLNEPGATSVNGN